MSDLISRKELLKVLRRYYANTVLHRAGLPDWGSTTNEVRAVFQTHGQVVKEIIETAPAIDAEPVRHGKWINVCEMLPPEYHDNKRCSVCANFALHDRLGRVRMSCYCPNCGSKMDLEDDQP